jgi:hypothetical protein
MKLLTLRQIKHLIIPEVFTSIPQHILDNPCCSIKTEHHNIFRFLKKYADGTTNGTLYYIINLNWNHIIHRGRYLEYDKKTGYFSTYSINNVNGNGKPKIYNEKGELQHYNQKILTTDSFKTPRMMVKVQNRNGVDNYIIDDNGKLKFYGRA